MPSLPTYEQAIEIIRAKTKPLRRTEEMAIADAMGLAVAETIRADAPYPRFDNSAVDGYLIGRGVDSLAKTVLQVVEVIAAGSDMPAQIPDQSAMRIFTGAPVPKDAYAVVMQEDVVAVNGSIALTETVDVGANIRRKGAEISLLQKLVAKGTPITPGVSALMALAGRVRAEVFSPPRVAVLTTGDELIDPSEKPKGSQIRDTNTVMLDPLVREATGRAPSLAHVQDDPKLMLETVREMAAHHDLIILAGGASVGDRDYVAETVEKLGQIHFHGAKIRPGKPILFGQIDECMVFGLPGNPASAYVCFQIFAKYAIRILAGWSDPQLKWLTLPALFAHRACGRIDFPRIQSTAQGVIAAQEQGSFGLTSIAVSDGVAMFPGDVDTEPGYHCRVLLRQ